MTGFEWARLEPLILAAQRGGRFRGSSTAHASPDNRNIALGLHKP